MKTKLLGTIFVIAFILMLQACGHTNNLAKYDLNKQRILFDYETPADIELQSNLSGSDIKTGSQTADVLIDIAKSVGTAAVTNEAADKLSNASNPKEIANAVSESMANSMVKFLAVEPVFAIDKEFAFIHTTRVKKITLYSQSDGLFLAVEADVELTQRGTAKLVWEYSDSETVALNGLFDDVDKSGFDGNISDILQLTELIAISDEKLRSAILHASSEIGKKISKVFKDDLSDS